MKKIREPMNAITHLAGGVLAVTGTVILCIKAFNEGVSLSVFISALVFGLSMTALYFTSGIYHSVTGPKERIIFMKKMDHSMIFVLIAGSYTPILMRITEGNFRTLMMSVIWICAISGIIFRILWINAPRWLYTASYLFMGWISVILLRKLTLTAGVPALILLALGGLFYTAGAVIYGLKKPDFSKLIGFHEVFHLFIMAGTLTHFIMIYKYIV